MESVDLAKSSRNFKVATKVLRNTSNVAKIFLWFIYEKSIHFSNVSKDSSVYMNQLHTPNSRSKMRRQHDPRLMANIL